MWPACLALDFRVLHHCKKLQKMEVLLGLNVDGASSQRAALIFMIALYRAFDGRLAGLFKFPYRVLYEFSLKISYGDFYCLLWALLWASAPTKKAYTRLMISEKKQVVTGLRQALGKPGGGLCCTFSFN